MIRLMTLSALALGIAMIGCGDDSGAPADAGADTGPDSGRDAGPSDAGNCETPCNASQLCCPTPTGLACVENDVDPANCGLCGLRCDEGRGTHCELGWCVCGLSDMGCLGTRNSTCCPARTDGGMPYCANLYTNPDSCGTCGVRCSVLQSDACSGGVCVCGSGRTGCTGEPDSICCPVTAGIGECVDSTTDDRNCGGCGITCTPLQRCTSAACISRDAGT